MKFLLLIIIAAAIYVGINWDTLSPEIDGKLGAVKELKQKADDFQENVQDTIDHAKDKAEDAKDKMDDMKDKMDDAKESASDAFEKLIEKVK